MAPALQRAFISVWDKTRLPELAVYLHEHGYRIVSTGGSARVIEEAGVAVESVESIVGQPAMMEGRLKTLDMRIFGPILFDRDKASHRQDLNKLGQLPIDLVVVNLYPFDQLLSDGLSREEMIEYIDIGGPGLLRAAAKNHRHVLVVGQTRHYDRLRQLIDTYGNEIPPAHREALAAEVFHLTARYDQAIASYFAADDEPLPAALNIHALLEQPLRYGENPHQQASFYLPPGSPRPWRQLHGSELSYNNYSDIDAAQAMVAEFAEPAVAIVKHANPCGFGLGGTPLEAWQRALTTDPVSSFGSIVAFNRPVDAATAAALAELFLEGIIAPAFEVDALDRLRKKKKLRLLEAREVAASRAVEIRSTAGGFLVQTRDAGEADQEWNLATQREPAPKEMQALRLAWKMVRFAKSNAIVFANDVQLLGVGAGQMSRVDAVRLAGLKAGQADLDLSGAVMASDAFFPFVDGVSLAAEMGIRAVVQPGGSIRDAEVIAQADELGLSMLFTGRRHFRH